MECLERICGVLHCDIGDIVSFDFNNLTGEKTVKKTIKFIDLFCGIGGIRLGMETQNFSCVFSSDINIECQKTYLENFNELPCGDIIQIDENDIPSHDILCAGFPCQPFSISGLRFIKIKYSW